MKHDVVVLDEGVDRVAVHQVGADLRRARVVGPEGDVEVLVVVGDAGTRCDRRRHVVARGTTRRAGRSRRRLPRPARRARRRPRSRRSPAGPGAAAAAGSAAWPPRSARRRRAGGRERGRGAGRMRRTTTGCHAALYAKRRPGFFPRPPRCGSAKNHAAAYGTITLTTVRPRSLARVGALFRGRRGIPNGIRTRVAALKGRSPRPLDDGDVGGGAAAGAGPPGPKLG